MNYREVEILAPEDLGTAGTKTIDINIADPISSIELIWRTTVVTNALMLSPHANCISKVEIVDGSNVITSLSGMQAQALYYYTQGVLPHEEISVDIGDYMSSVIPILFGRKLFDPLLALQPKKFTNPQIKVTWDEDAANTGVVANQLTVRAWVFDQKVIAPRGFLMAKEIKSFTPAANGYEYTDMPTDYIYRLIMLRQTSTDKNPYEVLATFKLSEEHDKRIPFDMTGDEIFRKINSGLPRIVTKIGLGETAAELNTLYQPITFDFYGNVNYDADVIAAADDYSQVTIAGNIVTVAATVAFVPYTLIASGYGPHHCLAVPCGDLRDIDDWYDVTKLGNLRLTTQGAAVVGTSPAAQIVLQQLRS